MNLRRAATALALLTSIALAPITSATEAPQAPLIPRETLFGNPDRARVQVSPDGTRIAFLAPVNGVLNVHVAPIDSPADARPVTKDTKRGIRQYFWSYANSAILYLQDDGGDENWKLHAVDVKSLADRDLTPFESIPGPDGKPIMQPNGKPLRPTTEIMGVSRKFPNEIVIGLNNRDPQLHDLYRVDLTTGALTKVLENTGYLAFVVDDDYQVRLAMRFTPTMSMEVFERVTGAEATWKPFTTIEGVDTETTRPIGFDASGQWLYMLDSRERNTSALYSINLGTGEKKLLAQDAKADAGNLLTHPVTGVVQAVGFEYLRNQWTLLDPSIKADIDHLTSLSPGDLSIASRSQDDKTWLVAFGEDTGPVRYFRYTRDPASGKHGKANFLFTSKKDLENLPLATMKPVVIKSRDGLDLVSYLTVPPQSDANRDGTPDQPIALVLDVHGGPWARDTWGFDPTAQWLANRGYACLNVNFRGSTGFGKAFINAADREWAGKMHNDLIDAVQWAINAKITTKDKVAIMGGSYGGYSTLVGLTFTPDVFACGVDIVGPSSLTTLIENMPPYWIPFLPVLSNRVGDASTTEGRAFLDSRSPLHRADKIIRPLLIGQGANDPRVKQSESDQIVSAMQRSNIPVTYVLFPDEGHGFARPANRIAFYAITEAFLAKHLNGRFEPIAQALAPSSVKVPAGAQAVPGLTEALRTTK